MSLLLLAACGAKSSASSAGATSTTAKGASGAAGFTAYRDCLAKNGVKLPAGGFRGAGGGTGAPAGSGAPTGTFPAGGAGGGAGASFRNNPAFQKAAKACASLRPKGGFGGGAGRTAFQAFASCMSSHGITIRGRGFDGGSSSTSSSVPPTSVDTSSPQYQAAYGVCKALLPAGAGSTTTTAAA